MRRSGRWGARVPGHRPAEIIWVALLALALVTPSAWAGTGARPASLGAGAALPGLGSVDLRVMPAVDEELLRAEDLAREQYGEPSPLRFAAPLATSLRPATDGSWWTAPDGSRIWRLRVVSPGARTLNLGLGGVRLPAGAELYLYPAGETVAPERVDPVRGPFTAADVTPEGELWTPIVPGDDAILELDVPAGVESEPELEVRTVNHDYRGFASVVDDLKLQGDCNIDVVCAQGDPWRKEIRSAAVYTLGGTWTCSGTLVNSHGGAHQPLFLTAYHCGVSGANAASMVVYWNFEAPVCGALDGGSLTDFQSGATFLASWVTSDFCLVRLNQTPDAESNVYYAGWDAREETMPAWAVAIHQPSCDEKAISFTNRPLTITTYLQNPIPGNGTHWRISYWDEGTTEPGSSGSGLWDDQHRLVGQLHGGYASCSQPTLSDWYGRLSRSWEGGGASANRLRDWLDPGGSGTRFLDGYDASTTNVPGDANEDGEVDALDLSAIVADILEMQALGAAGRTNADLDANGRISVVDLVRVVELILNPDARPSLPAQSVESPLVLSADLEMGSAGPELVLTGSLGSAAAVGFELRTEHRSVGSPRVAVEVEGDGGWAGAGSLSADGRLRIVLYTLQPSSGEAAPSRIRIALPRDAGRLEWGGGEAGGLYAQTFAVEANGLPLESDPSTEQTRNLSIWPNPARGGFEVQLRLERSGPVRFELFDAAGRRVDVWTRTDVSAGVNRLAVYRGEGERAPSPGWYFLRAWQEARRVGDARLIIVQ